MDTIKKVWHKVGKDGNVIEVHNLVTGEVYFDIEHEGGFGGYELCEGAHREVFYASPVVPSFFGGWVVTQPCWMIDDRRYGVIPARG